MNLISNIWIRFIQLGPLKQLTAVILLSIPLSAIFGGWSRISDVAVEPGSCIANHKVSLIGVITFNYAFFDEDCALHQTAMKVAEAAAITEPHDPAMMAVALTTLANMHPAFDEALGKVTDQMIGVSDDMQ
ncbi:hypothetical protein [Rhodovulum sp. P5]|uniref:hypothetical protein n=1 Tax=Rhodovulum sp. P5 TaxID=1564506 RepID=UPI0009DA6DDC|nr:hypothetical protein [Rhodovulum sp. P5]